MDVAYDDQIYVDNRTIDSADSTCQRNKLVML